MRVLSATSSTAGFAQDQAQLGCDLFGLLRRCRLAGADGPHGFVGNHDVRCAVDAGQCGAQLGDGNGARTVQFQVCGGLADADDRNESVLDGGGDLGGHLLVVLPVQRAALGVPDEHVRALELGEERTGDFTREGAGIVSGDILRAEDDGQLVR